MHKIYFYKDRNGNEPVFEYLKELASKKDKNSRINANKIGDYIEILSRYGTQAGEPYIKHLDGEIWELRPLAEPRAVCRVGKWQLCASASLHQEDAEDTVEGN